MSADYENLKKYVIASAKTHLATQLALKQLSIKVNLLEDRVKELDSENISATAQSSIDSVQSHVDDAFITMNESLDELLKTLENYANG